MQNNEGGGGIEMAAAATALGFPFTAVQWKELERQDMICKYIMACVPVPSHLLLPADPTAAPCNFISVFFSFLSSTFKVFF